MYKQFSICITFRKQLETSGIDDPIGWVDCLTIVLKWLTKWCSMVAWLSVKILVVIRNWWILNGLIAPKWYWFVMIILWLYWMKNITLTRIWCTNPTHCPNLMFLVWIERSESYLLIHCQMDNFETIHGNLELNLNDIHADSQTILLL